MSVALVSLLPLDTTGGGELFTIESAQAIRAAGTKTMIAAPVELPPPRADLGARLKTRFLWTDVEATHTPELLEWADVLARLADHDYVWLHQYLASDLTFDALSSVASDQRLLFTSLGYEPIRGLFGDLYHPCRGHGFVEISAYAARRARSYARSATWVRAGIWRHDMRDVEGGVPSEREYVALGRVLPHKGLETTIDALEADERLHVVGPSPDPDYAAFLRSRSRGRQVTFHGCLARTDIRGMLRQATALVGASTHRLFDGRRIEQPELLGLVLCEAVRDGTLPVASDVPAFLEVMTALGLDHWTFAEGEPPALRRRLDGLASLDGDRRASVLAAARDRLTREFSWDDYWPRVLSRLEETSACA
jgi:glycosyltransferase involved in cell wall biosynthesis